MTLKEKKEVNTLDVDIEKAAKRYAELEGKHGRVLIRLNKYSTEMADLVFKLRNMRYRRASLERALEKEVRDGRY